ncbi:MAG: DUF805 domain-containing protein [Deltaproteobacteria bacterium]|jgi:uncharacterized membrane protein YhaH (DUF805 family)|nr:DUF805 domain-containing protein [Deltaproteobacteria bacterium]
MNSFVSFFKLNLYDLAVESYRLLGGRTSRRDYWMYVLAQILVSLIVGVVALILANIPTLGPVLSVILVVVLYAIGLLLMFPNLVLSVRRLHDADMSGWWVLLCGILVGYILLALGGTPGPNRFGPSPASGPAPYPPLGYGQGGYGAPGYGPQAPQAPFPGAAPQQAPYPGAAPQQAPYPGAAPQQAPYPGAGPQQDVPPPPPARGPLDKA